MKLTDKRKLVLIASAVVLQLFVTISLLCYSARVKRHALKTGSVISLSCRAYDPFSPFKGRYVRLNFDQSSPQAESLDGESADCLDGRRGKKVYCRMAEGGDGLWTVAGIRCTLPGDRQKDGTKDDGVYIEARCRGYSYDFSDAGKKVRGVQLDYAFAEYYMQENYARYVDRIRWDDFNALEPVLSLYVGKNGRCVQKGLTVLDSGERIPIEEYCRRRLKK